MSGTGIRTVAVIGTGTIGASWSALFLAHGFDVVASDPAPDGEAKLRAFVDKALPDAAPASDAPAPGTLRFTARAEDAVAACDFIQENAPEREDLKARLIASLMAAAPPHAILGSSTTAFPRSALITETAHADRVIVAHPFNPPHLVPLVEIVGAAPDAPAVKIAVAFYRQLGREPVVLKKEAVGHLANRLQAALVREALYCLQEGIADVDAIDRALKYGPGLRWAWMGPFETYHLAGGAGGIRHYLDHLGPSQEKRWASLGQPQLTDELKAQAVAGVEAMLGDMSTGDLAARRDEALKAVTAAVSKLRNRT